jgi:hypothetical protein
VKTFDEHLDEHLEEMVLHLTIGQQPRPPKAQERDFALRWVSERAWRASVVALSHIPRTKHPRLELRRPRLYCEHRIPNCYVSQASVLLALLSCGGPMRRDGQHVEVALVARPPEMRHAHSNEAWVRGSVWPKLDIADHETPWSEWLAKYMHCFDGPQACSF